MTHGREKSDLAIVGPRDRVAAKCANSGGRLLGREVDAIQVLVHRGSADPELPRDGGRPETVGAHPADLGDPRGIQGPAAFVPARDLGPGDTFDLPLALEVVFKLRDHPEHGVEHLSHRGGGIDVLLGDVEGVTARFAQNRTLTGRSTCRLPFTTILREDYKRKIPRSCLAQPIPSANDRLCMPLKYRDFRLNVRFCANRAARPNTGSPV